MKRILILIILFIVGLNSFGQVIQKNTTYGMSFNRSGGDTLFWIPYDTLQVPTAYRSKSLIARKSSTLYIWDTTLFKWSAMAGGGGIDWGNITGTLSNQTDLITALNLKVDSVTTNSDSTTLRYWINGSPTVFYNFNSGLTGGDTTVLTTVLDSTGQAGQRVLFSGGNKIRSDSYFLYDSVNNKLMINHFNISAGGPNTKLFVNGNSNLNGTVTANSFVKSGGLSTQFLKADGSVDANSYATTASVALKVNISDTSGMLGNYITTPGYGLLKSGQSLLVDTGLVTTKAWHKKGIDSLASALAPLDGILDWDGTKYAPYSSAGISNTFNNVSGTPPIYSSSYLNYEGILRATWFQADIGGSYLTHGRVSVSGYNTSNQYPIIGIQTYGSNNGSSKDTTIIWAYKDDGAGHGGFSHSMIPIYIGSPSQHAGIYTTQEYIKVDNEQQKFTVHMTNTLFDKGVAKYGSNYGSLYDARTLVDKNYVDSANAPVIAPAPLPPPTNSK